MRYLNGFILIGLVLLGISLGGLATGNRLLTEPGQAVNPYSWLYYLGAAALMLINGAVSLWSARQAQAQEAREIAAKTASADETLAPDTLDVS